MDLSQFRHQSDSRYCFSLDDHRVFIRLAVARSCPLRHVNLVYGDTSTFYRDQRRVTMELAHTDSAFHYYEAIMENAVPRFFYVFEIESEEGRLYFSESGLTVGFVYDLAFLSAFQFNGENRADYCLEKPSWQGRVFYQIFPERFACKGDPKEKDYVDTPWDCGSLKGKHKVFLGGDLWGATEKLDYLASLGVEAVYLTPIHPSPSNHKYDIRDYFDVDPSFGGKEAFKAFCKKAHSLGMKVMMDLVFNHFSSLHPFFLDVTKNGRKSPYHSWFFIDGDKPRKLPLNYRCFGYFPYMPKVDTNNPEVQDYLISIGEYWMKEFGVDGYRLDVSEGVSHEFWIRFKLALRKIDPEVLLIGENWLNAESFLGPSQLDGVMNYPFLGAVCNYVLEQKDAVGAAESFEGLLMRYKDGTTSMMLNILASHDIQRFRNLVHGDKDKALMGYALLTFFPGYPLIYYGEEIFMEGAGDPDNRRGMLWNSPEFSSQYFETFKKLLWLRREKALKAGKTKIFASRGALIVERHLQKEAYRLTLNLTHEGISLDGTALFGNRLAGNEVWPKGFAVSKIELK